MPHSLLQALKSSIASRALIEPLGPSPLSYATVVALSPSLPPPSYIDRIGALEKELLGGSAHGANSRPDLFLPAHAVVLLAAFLVVLLWYGETFGQKSKTKRCLGNVPQHDYNAKARASKPCPFPSHPSQQAEEVEKIKEESTAIEDLQEKEHRDEWCIQVYASILASLGALKEEIKTEKETDKELEEAMASMGPHLYDWLDTRPPPDLMASSPNGLLLLAYLIQNHRLVTQKKHMSGPDPNAMGSDIPELSECMPELEENECCDIPEFIYLSDK